MKYSCEPYRNTFINVRSNEIDQNQHVVILMVNVIDLNCPYFQYEIYVKCYVMKYIWVLFIWYDLFTACRNIGLPYLLTFQ